MTNTHAQLCRYHYDPLDRLATCLPTEQNGIQRFYQKNRLTTEIQGQIQRAFFQTGDQLLAQHQGPNTCTLLASDQQRSVLEGLDASQRQSVSYTPYGVRHPQANPLGLLGFTGERVDPVTGNYLLGNGYRAYNPVLMRFNSPDSLSPFGEGGLNAYAYCLGDPVNRVDPTGHIPAILKPLLRALRIIGRPKKSPINAATDNNVSSILSAPGKPKKITFSPDTNNVSSVLSAPEKLKKVTFSPDTKFDEKIVSIQETLEQTKVKSLKTLRALYKPGKEIEDIIRYGSIKLTTDELRSTVLPHYKKQYLLAEELNNLKHKEHILSGRPHTLQPMVIESIDDFLNNEIARIRHGN